MSEIQSVWVQIRGPQGHDPGQVELGHFKILETGELQMCSEDGKPTGRRVALGPGDRPQRIAARLTKETWAKRNAKANSDFNRTIVYPDWKPA